MPYIPNHQFNAGISLEHKKFETPLSRRYIGEYKTMAGSGAIAANQKIESNFVIDL